MILVTGFGPYREPMNASGELVRSLQESLPAALAPLKDLLAFEVISCDDTSRRTEHESLESQLLELLNQYKPNLCIHTGQAPPYNRINIEKIATNSFMREVIDPDRPVGYWANLPGLDRMRKKLELDNIPACYSFYGGQHLCNHILYSSLYFSEHLGFAHKAGFVHVPLLPEQVMHKHHKSPFMTMDMLRAALVIIINNTYKESGLDDE